MLATVCLLLFSGRPPPCWTLDADGSAAVASRLQALPPGRGELRQGLGYSGVSVELDDPRAVHATLRGGVVQVSCGGEPPETCSDVGCALERWLLETGRAAFPDLIPGLLDTGASPGP